MEVKSLRRVKGALRSRQLPVAQRERTSRYSSVASSRSSFAKTRCYNAREEGGKLGGWVQSTRRGAGRAPARDLRCRGSSGSGEEGEGSDLAVGETRTLPVFPLGMVPIPFANVPLHIFEARYRVLFSTLLYGESGIEEGLADPNSEFAGSKEFGMCYVDKEGNIASVGCLLNIGEHQLLDDGRLYIQNKATKRFQVTEVVEQKPVLICKVKFIEENSTEVDKDPETCELAKEVADIFQKALSLGSSLEGSSSDAEAPTPPKPEQLNLPPTELSYWLATLFPQDPQEQQLMLQIIGSKARLERLKEIFEATYNYHLAKKSIKSAFGGSDAVADE